MEITFTESEFKTLIKAVYLGGWMANAERSEDWLREFDSLESLILSHAEKAGLKEYAEFSREDNAYYPSADLDEELEPLIDEYNDSFFWEELESRLADRDLLRTHAEGELRSMEPPRFWELKFPIEKTYAKEFEKHGLDRLEITTKKSRYS